MQIVPRDYQIIEWIGRARVLTDSDLVTLFPSDPQKVATNKKDGVASGQYLLKQRMPFLAKQGYIIISKGNPTLYTLATGDENALASLYAVLPTVIEEILGEKNTSFDYKIFKNLFDRVY